MSGDSLETSLRDHIEVLKSACVDDGTNGDQIMELLEGELEDVKLKGLARDKVICSIGYILGVAAAHDCTLLELFEEYDLP